MKMAYLYDQRKILRVPFKGQTSWLRDTNQRSGATSHRHQPALAFEQISDKLLSKQQTYRPDVNRKNRKSTCTVYRIPV